MVLGADGSAADLIHVRRASGLVHMEGHETFRHGRVAARRGDPARRSRPPSVALDDIDLFVYHQANGRIMRAVAERLELPAERVVDCIEGLANTSAASIPLALRRAAAEGRLVAGRARAARGRGRGVHLGRDHRRVGCVMTPNGSALVTGASRGIGAAVARALAADGWRVGINYRSDEQGAARVAREIEAEGGSAAPLAGDVSDPATAERLLTELEERFGPVLVLVNNAGVRDDARRPPDRRRGLVAGARDKPQRRVPAHPPGAAPDDQASGSAA